MSSDTPEKEEHPKYTRVSGSVSLGWSLKEGLVEEVGVTPGAGVSSVLPLRGLRIPGSTPVAPLQAGRAVGQSPEPLVHFSGVLVRDEAWGLRDWPIPSSCAASIMLLPPRLAPLLAPEPSNLAGKDKHKSCVHAPVDLITRQWFPGQRLDFKIRGGGAGDGMFARRVQSWSVFLWPSPY